MQNKFYQPDEQRAKKVRELFAVIARRYDLLNDIMSAGLHRRWKRQLVEMALRAQCGQNSHPDSLPCEPREREVSSAPRVGREDQGEGVWPTSTLQVLDLCCGTGDIGLLFQRSGARVAGADFTEEMLRVAATRCSRESHSRPGVTSASEGSRESVSRLQPTWIQADALRLPFPDDSFHVVSVGYGLRNLTDLETGLEEILRVLRPGGKLLSLDFGKPESGALRTLYFGYLRTVLPLLGRVFCGDPDTYAYIHASLKNYPAQRRLNTLMANCGFSDCGFVEFVGGAMAINFGSKPR